MIKLARKSSSDPVQEKLRANKASLNKEISLFVNDLIHFKKLMNGWANKFNMQKSRIVDPIPADPATIIGSLAGDFHSIVQKSNDIIKEQVEYSKNRKKKQTKDPGGFSSPAIAEFEYKYGLIAEGSNSVTRFFSKILNPSIGVSEAARVRKYRNSLLDACAKSYKNLGKLQVEVVGSSKNSILESSKLLQQVWDDWMVIYRGYALYKSNMPKEVKDSGGEIFSSDFDKNKEQVKSTVPEITDITFNTAKLIVKDFDLSKNNFPDDIDMFGDLSDAISLFSMPVTIDKKLEINNNIILKYKKILKLLNDKYNTSGTTLRQILEEKSSLEKVAQDLLKKWIRKTKHELSFFDSKNMSHYRLDVYNKAGDIRNIIDKIMNSLEKDMNINELDPLIMSVNKELSSIRSAIRELYHLEPTSSKSSKMLDPKGMGLLDRMRMLEKYM